MKKALFALCATLITATQFGCSGGWKIAHDVFAHIVGVASILDIFNIIGGA